MKFLFLFLATINIFIFLKALTEGRKGNSFGLTRWLLPIGAFVWGDAVVFSTFWALVSLLCWWLADINLFWLIISLFWAVRGAGETIYWLNEQFAQKHRNPPESLWGYALFKSEAIWFVYQIVWQCVTVVAIVGVIYFAKAWLT